MLANPTCWVEASRRLTAAAIILGLSLIASTPVDAQNAVNSASVSLPPAVSDPDSANNSASDSDGITRTSNLSLSKSDSPDPVNVGSILSYTLTISNAGPSAILSSATFSIVESLPVGLTACSYTPSLGTFSVGTIAPGTTGTGTWTGASIASGGSRSLIITCTVGASAASTLSNTASVIPPTGTSDPDCSGAPVSCTGGNAATISTTVNRPQLTLIKTASSGAFTVGVPASYTLELSNTGTSSTTATSTITDTLPTGLTLGTLPASCSASGQTVTCTRTPGLAAGQTASFVIPVTPTAAAQPSVTNTATVSGGGDSSCPAAARCTGTVGPTPVNAPQITLTKTASSASFVVGVPASYTLELSNTGTGATTAAATLTDTIPTGLTIGTLAAGCSASGQTVTCTVPAGLAAGGSTSYVIPVTPTAAAQPSVTNTATASGGGDSGCPAAARCTGSVGPTPVNAPQITLTKTASSASFTIGVPASFTLELSNTGTAATTAAATLTDTVPTGLTIGTLAAGCSASGQTVTCTVPAGLAAGGSTSYVIPVTPTAAAQPSVTNTATASGGGDSGCPAAARCSDSIGPISVDGAQLTLSKTASAASFTVGVPASYTLSLENTGTSATTAASTITDTIPSGLTIGTLPAGCTAAGQSVTCTVPAGLAAGSSTSYVIPVTPTAAAQPSVTNTATVSGGGDPGCPAAARCSDSVGPTPVTGPELTLTKTASAASFVVGTPASYTLQLSNTGTSATTAVSTITDTIPSGLSLGTLPAGCTAAGQTVTCTIASGLAAGGSTSFVIPVTPTAAAQPSVTNTATVSGGGDPACPAAARCSDSVGPTPVNAAQLTITKTASAAGFVVGTPASYTLSVENTGSAATTAASTITDTIPTGLTIGTLPAGCSASGQTVTCTVPAGLAAGGSSSFVIPVTPTAAAQPSVTNTATVSGGGDPGCPAAARCSDSVGPTAVNGPELTITKTASAASFTVGTPASYTLQLSNTGTSATTAVSTITDTIPSGLTLGTLPAGCTAAGQSVTCTVASGLAAGSSSSFVIPVTPTATAQPSVTNTATVSGGGDPGCPAAARCSDSVGPTPVNGPELTITKTASAASLVVGIPASYTLQLSNTGTSATTAVSTITDTIPSGLTLGTLPAGCTAAGQSVTCTVPAGLAAGGSTSYVIPVTPTSAAQPSVTNTATVSGGGDPGCPAAARCSDSVGPTPVNAPQLTLTKTASAASFVVSTLASYTLAVENTGSAATTAVSTITDTIPSGLTLGTLPAGCTASGQTVTCTIAAGLAAGGSTSFVIPVTPTAAAQPSVTNTATVSGGGDPGCPAAARCSDSVGPTPVNAAQLTLTKTASAASFTVGVPASYTLSVENTGTAATTSVATITDTIPSGLTLGTLSAGCTAAGQTVTCTIASGLAAGDSTSFVIPVTATAAAQPSVTNTATVSGGGDSSCPAAARCSDSVGPTAVNGAELTLSKTASAASFIVGVPASYTLEVSNTGTSATTAVATITDTIPSGLTLGTLPVGCTAAGQTVTCTIASGLAAGDSASFVIPVTPTATAQPSVTNTATVSGGGDPGCPAAARCSDSIGPTPVNAAQLTLTKTASAVSFVVGTPASYTLSVENTGSAATTAVSTIADTIPSGLTLGTLPAGCTASGQAVTCTIAAGLAAGSSTTFVIPVTATAAAQPSVTNTATVSGGGDPGCPAAARCSDSVGPTAVNAPQLTLTKTASAASFVVGTPASYRLSVQNTGSAATTAVSTIADPIPNGLTLGTLPAGCTAAGQTVTCTIASGLAAGGSTNFVIPVTPTAAAQPSVTNTATASGGGDSGCPAAARCSDSVGPTPVNAAQLTLTKTASAASFVVGTPASYTLAVQNTGSAATTAVSTIADTISSGLTLGTLPAGCTAAGQTVTCTIAVGLAVGDSTSFVLQVTATAAAQPSVTNTATVSGGGDPGCPAAARCSDSVGPTPVNAAQLILTKTASAASFVVGTPASYTLSVENTGSAATTSVATITDTISSGLTLGTLPAGCTAAGQTVTCTVPAGLAVGDSTSFVIPVTPTAAAQPSVTNTATVSGGGDPGCPAAARCSDSVGPTPVNAAQLTITKTASAASFVVGTSASYTLAVENTGSAATTAASTITDTIPSGLTLGTLPAGCTASGQTVTCTIAAGLAAGGSTSFVIPVIATAAAQPSVTNTATVSGGGDPGCPAAARCSDSVGPTAVNAAQLTLSKTASAASFTVGVPGSYTLSVQNTGSAATTAAATVTDNIPTTLALGTLPAGCTAAGQTVTCTIATGVAVGDSTSFVIPVTPTAAAQPSVTNTATVSGGGDPGCPAAARCSDSVGPTPVNAAQLTLTKTASAASFVVGTPASYTLSVQNTGSAATTAVSTIADPIPNGLTLGTLPAGCTAAGQTVTCTIASGLAAGGSTNFVIPVTPTAAAQPSVTNTATASGGGDSGCPAAARCSDSVGPTPVNAAQLTLTKTASAASFVVGTPASYTLAVENTGSAATTAASTITDTIPSGLTLGTLPAGCTAAGQTVTCTIASGLAIGASTSFVIPVTPTAAAQPSVTNTATVSGGGDPGCPAAARCSDSVGPTPVNAAQLTITKTASAASFVVGTSASYTLAVENTGSAATTAASTIIDTIPSGLTLGTLPAGCTAAGQTVTCTVPAGLAVGDSTSFVIPVTPTAAAQPSVTNTATVSGGGDPGCPAAARCSDSVGPTPVNAPQLTITKTASAASFTVGVPASYTLSLENTGSTATTAVGTITDSIPSGLILGSLPAGCTAAGQTVTCTIAAGLAVGDSTSFVIPVTPTAAAQPSVTNTATVSGGGDPGCPAAARCSDSLGPTAVNAAQLTLTKTASAASFVVGTAASYTLSVENTGSAATTAVSTITDTIPSGLALGTLPSGCVAAGQTVTCTIAAGLAVGSSTSFVIPVTPTAAAQPSVTNTATVSGGGDPGCPAAARCSDSVGPTPVNAAQLTLTKTASAVSFVVGTPASYTLSVENTGSAATTAVSTIADTIPNGLTLGTLPAGCTAAGQTVTCTIATGVAVGDSTSFVIPVTPTAAAQPSVTNTATVSGGGDPGCPAAARCSDSVGPTAVNAPQLTLTKTASAASFVVGSPASYTLSVQNTGSAATTAVSTITDTLPSGLTLGTLPAGCTAAGQAVTCTIAAGLAVGDSTSFVIPVTPTVAAQPSVTNTATVSGGGDPGCPAAARCSDSVGPTPVNAAQLTITKTASAASFVVSTPASYTLSVQNTGSAATTAVATVTDNIPASLTLGTQPAGCTAAGQTVTCTIASGLAAGASLNFVIPVTPTAAATPSVQNTASVSGGGDPGCPASARCSSTITTPVRGPNVALAKTANPASGSRVVVGNTITYTLQATVSDAPLTAAFQLTDTLGVGLLRGAVTAGPFTCGASEPLVCSLPSGTATGTYSLSYTATVQAGATVTVSNSVSISGSGGDPDPVCSPCITTHPLAVADLQVLKTVDQMAPSFGQVINFTLQVRNNGPDAATNVVVTDALPSGFELLGTTPSQGSYTAPLWTVGNLAVGETETLVMQVRVRASGNYRNVATVRGDQLDPINNNNEDAVSPTPPSNPRPAVIPVDAPWALLSLVLLMFGVAGLQLRRRG